MDDAELLAEAMESLNETSRELNAAIDCLEQLHDAVDGVVEALGPDHADVLAPLRFADEMASGSRGHFLGAEAGRRRQRVRMIYRASRAAR